MQDKVDYLHEAVTAVKLHDDVRLGRTENPNFDTHKNACNHIKVCNAVHGQGFISFSKARTIIAERHIINKIKLANEQARLEKKDKKEKRRDRGIVSPKRKKNANIK